jgi:hypothetical protein
LAKKTMRLNIKNATIDFSEGKIFEETKDELIEHNISDVLKMWDGVNGVDITFSHKVDFKPKQV